MLLSSIGTRAIASVSPDDSVEAAARLMEEREVGSVLVAVRGKPLGIVTDRDLVLRVVDRGLDPTHLPVGSVMSTPVVCVSDSDSLLTASALMREHGVRRLPIVDDHDRIIAMLTYDDLVRLLGRTHRELADMIETFPVPFPVPFQRG
jgi:CBS domain-containing protein